MNNRTILTRRGYVVIKNKFNEKELVNIKKKLTVKPCVHRDYNKFVEEFPVYYENESKLYLPRFWGLENLGKPDKVDLTDGDKINIKCIYEPRPEQKPLIKKIMNILKTPVTQFIVKEEKISERKLYGTGTILSVYCGFGKCLGKNTPILMFDGTIKKVQNIKKGELLMGDDSNYRTVLNTCSGIEMMYEIKQSNGINYIVNESHILSLYCTKNFKNIFKKGEIVDINVKYVLYLHKKYHNILSILKGYITPVLYKEKFVEIDPYIFGCWLCDIQNILCYNKKYNLYNKDYISNNYKANSFENRIKLLCGMIYSSSLYINNQKYTNTIIVVNKLKNDVISICNSLGLYTSIQITYINKCK